jgi:Sulfotransferase family
VTRSSEPKPGAKVTVAYIGGSARCGSTLLDLLLGQLRGFVAVGSLSNLWERGLQKNNLCGCGVSFRQCPFWTRVGDEAFGGWDAVDANELVRLQSEVARYRHLPWHFAPRLRPAFFEKVVRYAEYMARLYEAIKSVSGCSIVVDSSKDVADAVLLRRMPNVDAHIVHLVRDSRGVAFSWSKWLLRPEFTTSPTYMPRYGPAYASIDWVAANLPYHLIGALSIPRLFVRYESLVKSPRVEIARIADFLGANLAQPDLSFLDGASGEPVHDHTVSGNPMRFDPGPIRIRLDDEWRVKMRWRDRTIVTLLTWPLGLAYGYVGARSSRDIRGGPKARSA